MSTPIHRIPATEPPTPAVALPRPLAEQFTRSYPHMPCCLTMAESNQFAGSRQTGYAPWHAELLTERATWGLDEAHAA